MLCHVPLASVPVGRDDAFEPPVPWRARLDPGPVYDAIRHGGLRQLEKTGWMGWPVDVVLGVRVGDDTVDGETLGLVVNEGVTDGVDDIDAVTLGV